MPLINHVCYTGKYNRLDSGEIASSLGHGSRVARDIVGVSNTSNAPLSNNSFHRCFVSAGLDWARYFLSRKGRVDLKPEHWQTITDRMAKLSINSEIVSHANDIPSLIRLSVKSIYKQPIENTDAWKERFINIQRLTTNPEMTIELQNLLYRELLVYMRFNQYPVISMSIASERVMNGESCKLVAGQHGIPSYVTGYKALQMVAVNGPAGARVRAGESCEKVAQDFGIPSCDNAYEALQMVAVNGPAGARVRNGESFMDVALDFGIPSYDNAWVALKEIAERALAARRY